MYYVCVELPLSMGTSMQGRRARSLTEGAHRLTHVSEDVLRTFLQAKGKPQMHTMPLTSIAVTAIDQVMRALVCCT